MKSYQMLLIALVVACASAFAPVAHQKTALVQPLALSKAPEPEGLHHKKAVAMAAFATAVAPLAANAVDDTVVMAWGAGLVACVVSLAVGFAIGYGTLAKL
jgi:hypothetical protein